MDLFIGLASNRDPESNLDAALTAVRQLGMVLGVSSTHRSAAIGAPEEPDYLNRVCLIRTSLDSATVRDRLKTLERQLGRRPAPGPVTIDLDMLLVAHSNEVLPPHRDLLERPAVALALGELAPHLRHPTTGETFEVIAKRLNSVPY